MRTSILVAAAVAFAGFGCNGKEASNEEPRIDAGNTESDAAPQPQHTCVAPERPPSLSRIELVEVFSNVEFSLPTGLHQAPGEPTRWYVVEQGGTIKKIDVVDGVATATDFLETPLTVDVGTTWEGGLLGFAFHPEYATNGTAFLGYTVSGTSGLTQRIARYKRNESGTLAFDAVIFERPTPSSSVRQEHNIGAMAFGPDGYLYVGIGDGYVLGDDPANPAQDPNSVFGKILRIDVGPTGTYTIPDGNPYKAGGGAPEVFALGLRNPWRFSFDRVTGELWAGDVGDDTFEEINKVELGKNYGWSVMEGDGCHHDTSCDVTGLELPIVQYGHQNGLFAVIGGYVYRGTQYPSLQGTYFYGDFSGRIWSLPDGTPPARVELDTGLAISAFAEGHDGELYVVAYEGASTPARIFKIEGLPPAPPSTFPDTLSATGCVDPDDPSKPGYGMLPYEVNSPLWSDGAEKRRWMSIPEDTKIHIADDGDFEFPIGTVLVKEFRLEGEPVETRLFMRHPDGAWGGYSYEWADDGSDAHLLEGEKTATVAGQGWFFPGRGQCFSCHTAEAKFALGPEVSQLNRTVQMGGMAVNQLEAIEALQLLDAPLGDVSTLPRMPEPFGTEPLEARARSYLHANCSFCHRPGGTGRGPHNLLYSAGLEGMNVCNVPAEHGEMGLSEPLLLAPGDPAGSILVLRMKTLGNVRMPPLATSEVDSAATDMIDAWITSVTTCP